MKTCLSVFVIGAAAALAQPGVTTPSVGMVRDLSGSVHAMVGIAGNFIVLDTNVIANAVSAAFSGSAGLVKTDSEVLVLDAAGQITGRYDAPAGPALFAFDPSGAPALAYYSHALFRFENNELKPVNWSGSALSIALAGPQAAMAIVRRGNQLRNVRITLATGDIESETGIGRIAGPLLLVSSGSLLFTRDDNIVVRDASGAARLVPAGFTVGSFEVMGRDWIAVREAADGRSFALHIAEQSLELYQLPEATQ